jgi:hypothetical protein
MGEMCVMQAQRPGQHCTFVLYQPSLSNDLHDEVSDKLIEREWLGLGGIG